MSSLTANPVGRYRSGAAALLAGASVALGPVPASSAPPDSRAAAEQPDVPEAETLRMTEAAPLTPDEALDARHIGERVRWAGGVYAIDGGCLTINYARSGDHGEPRWTPEPTYQSFVACGPGTYDPELVHPYSNVTIIGRITGKRYIGMGGGGSDGPAISIEKLYRWSDCLAGDDSPVCRQGFLGAEPDMGEQG